MNCTHHHRHSIFCIIPPYVLDQIAQKGTPAQRTAALRTKSVDNTFRALRLASQPGSFSPARGVAAAAAAAAGGFSKRRAIYSAAQSQSLPGSLLRAEGQGPTGDPAADEAYDGLGATFDFFARVLERNSIDDEGLALNATVHFGQDYNNAFWNSEQMVFGDGDGEIFNRFTISLDVIGHELSHGVTEDESRLMYFNQPGALNESMSDVFGSMIKQYALKQNSAQADWLIGEGLLAAGINGVALRSMKDPGTAFDDPLLGKDPQPKHMNHFVHTFEDNGGVHINSGIPNHAFYQVASRLGGNAWDKAGRIWYDALRDAHVRPNTGFKRFARVTYDTAARHYGQGGAEHKAVHDGWATVGIEL